MRYWYNLCFFDLKLGWLLISVIEFLFEIVIIILKGIEVRIVNCYFVGSMNIEIIGIVFIFSLSYFKIVDNGIY